MRLRGREGWAVGGGVNDGGGVDVGVAALEVGWPTVGWGVDHKNGRQTCILSNLELQRIGEERAGDEGSKARVKRG